MDCCNREENKSQNRPDGSSPRRPRVHDFDFDLLIIGSGSAAFAAAIRAIELGKTVAIVEKDTLGGTCVNFGCVPSKTLIRAAETNHRIHHSNFQGISAGVKSAENAEKTVDFPVVMAEKNALVSDLQKAKYQSVLDGNEDIHFISGEASFIDPHSVKIVPSRTVDTDGTDDADGDTEPLELGGDRFSAQTLSADKVLIATGSRDQEPMIPGLESVNYLTSRTAFELESLPRTLAVLGGGFVAIETAQMFSRLGSKVILIQRSRLMSGEDQDLSDGIRESLVHEGIDVYCDVSIESISTDIDCESGEKYQEGGLLDIRLISKEQHKIHLMADHILVCTGRVPNTQGLNLSEVGISLDALGGIEVNEFGQTSRENIYAAGDVLSTEALVYVAAYEGNLAVDNAFNGNGRSADYLTVPWVVFSDPQICGVGLSEKQAKASGIEVDVSRLDLSHVPRAIAARDTRGYIKLLRKKGTDQLVGARVFAPEGAELLMELSLMIRYKLPISEIAKSMHVYLTLSEAVKLAAQTFDKDVSTLSCCAV